MYSTTNCKIMRIIVRILTSFCMLNSMLPACSSNLPKLPTPLKMLSSPAAANVTLFTFCKPLFHFPDAWISEVIHLMLQGF